MNAVFADTFYWIALTNLQDIAHEKAKSFALSAAPGALCTTEEVLTEYLNYFAAWGSNFGVKPRSMSRICWRAERCRSYP